MGDDRWTDLRAWLADLQAPRPGDGPSVRVEALFRVADVAALLAERDALANRSTTFAYGQGHLVTCEEHDALRWWSLDARCPWCVADGLPGVALAHQRVDIVEVVKQLDAAHAANASLEARVVRAEQVAAAVAEERDAALARAEKAESAARTLHEEACAQAVQKIGIWNGLDIEKARADKAEKELDAALARAERAETECANLERGATGLFHRSERALERAEKAEARVAELEAEVIRTRADVEERLAQVGVRRIRHADRAFVEASSDEAHRAALVDLVCAVLGVPDAG